LEKKKAAAAEGVEGEAPTLLLLKEGEGVEGEAPPTALSHSYFTYTGGSFYSNGGRLYPGEVLASKGVVVVTINYRLGPFGFLSTADGAARGNWGLLDQRLALLWVRRHAPSFGGSPTNLVLMGNSAGAASVLLHLVSPLSKGLFSRAVALSGVFTGALVTAEEALTLRRAPRY
ncbi:hypothetical protein Pcinc_030126, partial [Petrolisthes cinctipes]